jgi:hypothetical protein
MPSDPVVARLPITKSQFLEILRDNFHFLEESDVELLLNNHSHKLKDVLAKTKDIDLLRALCESSIVRMRQIYCNEVGVWREREVISTFDSDKTTTWMKNCKTRHLKAARRARAMLELHREYKKFKKI